MIGNSKLFIFTVCLLVIVSCESIAKMKEKRGIGKIISFLKGKSGIKEENPECDGENESNVVTPELNSTEAKLTEQSTRKKGLLDFWKSYEERPHLRFWRPSFVTPKLGNTTQGNETEQTTQGKSLLDFLVKHDRTPSQREYLYSRFMNSSFVTASLKNNTRKNMTHQVLRSKGILDLFKRETTAEPAHVEDFEFSPEDISDNEHHQQSVQHEEESETINKATPSRKPMAKHRCEGQRKVKKGMLSNDRKKSSKGIIKNISHGRPTEKGEKDQGEGGNTVPATECCPNEIKSLFPTHH